MPDGNEVAGIRLPDIAVPLAAYTGWNEYKAPYPMGEIADRDGSYFAFPAAKIAQRYRNRADYVAKVQAAVDALKKDRLLLQEDADKLPREGAQRKSRESLMAKLDRNGVAIHYEVHGPVERKHRRSC